MNKKILISLLFILLTGWISGYAYWYDFKIKKKFETGLINGFLSDSYEEVSNYELEEIKITKPSFSISDGGIIISESLDNISFISGTAEMEIPDSMEEGLNQLATYLKKIRDYLYHDLRKTLSYVLEVATYLRRVDTSKDKAF